MDTKTTLAMQRSALSGLAYAFVQTFFVSQYWEELRQTFESQDTLDYEEQGRSTEWELRLTRTVGSTPSYTLVQWYLKLQEPPSSTFQIIGRPDANLRDCGWGWIDSEGQRHSFSFTNEFVVRRDQPPLPPALFFSLWSETQTALFRYLRRHRIKLREPARTLLTPTTLG